MSVNKFKVGDVVKCVNVDGINDLTFGQEYTAIQVYKAGTVSVVYESVGVINDIGKEEYYYSHRFELSKGGATTPSKFKEGDMVYLIGFDCLKPRKLQTGFNNGSPMKFKVEVVNDVFETFAEDGKFLTKDATPSIVIATEENRLILNKLLGVEYEPLKLTGSDLAKKLLKDKPQTCWISDVSDERAVSSCGVTLIVEFENGSFISKSGTGWKFAVPCDKHGEVLDDE